MEDNTHVGHRQRMREKYLRDGAEAFETHRLLEMLLFNSIPRNDTNPTAHKLINAGKESGYGLLCADYDTLCSAEGVGDKSAFLVRTSIDTTLRLLTDSLGSAPLDDDFTVRLYLFLKLAARRERCAIAVMLNRRGCVICCADLARGPIWRSDDFVGETLKLAKSENAASVIICHNHKNGDETPSVEDYYLTAEIKRAIEAEGIGFGGHYIVTQRRCIKIELQKDTNV